MLNNKKTIYIHIGMPKSGSSSIQNFLYENREKLKEYGVLYPVIPTNKNERNYNIVEAINFRHIYVNVLSKGKRFYNKYFKNVVIDKILKNDSAYEKCDKIVFSEEILFYKDNSKITDVMTKNGYDVKIIVCFRNPAEYLTSLWQENLKPYLGNFDIPLEKFLDETDPGYHVINKFIKKLGRENVIILPFGKDFWKNGNLIDDFLSALGVENFEGAADAPKVNNSFNRYVCEYLLALKSLNLPREKFDEMCYKYALSLSDEKESQNLDKNSPVEITRFIEKFSTPTPKIADTVSPDKLAKINEKYRNVISEIAPNCDLNKFLTVKSKTANEDVYNKSFYTMRQLEIIRDAQKYARKGVEYTFLQQIFSARNIGKYKVISILGIKIRIKR